LLFSVTQCLRGRFFVSAVCDAYHMAKIVLWE
jgi:hypothetical protein